MSVFKGLEKSFKEKYAGLHRVWFVSQITIWEHNFGYSKSILLKSIGFETSSHINSVGGEKIRIDRKTGHEGVEREKNDTREYGE